LNVYAQKKLGKDYQRQGQSVVTGTPTTSPGKGGIIYLTFTAKGTWRYSFNANLLQNLRTPIKGASSDVAKTYLKSQPGVADVSVQLPFGTDHLPNSINDIEIILSPAS
jgi:hypothetical protein